VLEIGLKIEWKQVLEKEEESEPTAKDQSNVEKI